MGNNTWLYVLSNGGSEDSINRVNDLKTYFYVGQTTNLIKRLEQHERGDGAMATRTFSYQWLEAVYNLGPTDDVFYDRLAKEDELTLQLMKLTGQPFHVRGGRWTLHGLTRDFQQPAQLKDIALPFVCDCGLPASKISSSKGVFYKCPRPGDFWHDKILSHDTLEPCEFFKPAWKCVPPVVQHATCSECGNICLSSPCYACSSWTDGIDVYASDSGVHVVDGIDIIDPRRCSNEHHSVSS